MVLDRLCPVRHAPKVIVDQQHTRTLTHTPRIEASIYAHMHTRVLCVLIGPCVLCAGAEQRPSQRDLNHVGVTAEWRQLGVELGVSVTTLDEVEYDHRHEGIREVRSKMFEAWLKDGPSLTWRTLIRAMEKIGLAEKAATVVAEHDLQQ